MTCDRCNKELEVGQWPWCPHEDARHFGEDPMEPYWDENISKDGAYITSRAERRKIMAREGVEYKDLSYAKRGKVYVFK